jgi:hypothetical protein
MWSVIRQRKFIWLMYLQMIGTLLAPRYYPTENVEASLQCRHSQPVNGELEVWVRVVAAVQAGVLLLQSCDPPPVRQTAPRLHQSLHVQLGRRE